MVKALAKMLIRHATGGSKDEHGGIKMILRIGNFGLLGCFLWLAYVWGIGFIWHSGSPGSGTA
jgi:hypothetical protein